ncbi:hypothetical protein RUM44_002520 [Polyplax serrata]
MRFVRRQLLAAYNDLKDYMNVELVPFGKAHFSRVPWRITCQHGPQECLGNAIQACAIARYPDTEMQIKFIHCVMSDNFPPAVGSKCARMLNYPYNGVEECARSDEGNTLIANYGDRTMEFKDSLRFIPTIVLDNEYDENNQNMALRNLKAAVCAKLGQQAPDTCR